MWQCSNLLATPFWIERNLIRQSLLHKHFLTVDILKHVVCISFCVYLQIFDPHIDGGCTSEWYTWLHEWYRPWQWMMLDQDIIGFYSLVIYYYSIIGTIDLQHNTRILDIVSYSWLMWQGWHNDAMDDKTDHATTTTFNNNEKIIMNYLCRVLR